MIQTKADCVYGIQSVNMNKFVNIENAERKQNILSLSIESCKRGLEAGNHYKSL